MPPEPPTGAPWRRGPPGKGARGTATLRRGQNPAPHGSRGWVSAPSTSPSAPLKCPVISLVNCRLKKRHLRKRRSPPGPPKGLKHVPSCPAFVWVTSIQVGEARKPSAGRVPNGNPNAIFLPPLHPRLRSGAKEGDAGSSSHPQNKDAFGGKKARGSILLPYLLSSEFPQHYSLALEEVIHSRPRNAVSSR